MKAPEKPLCGFCGQPVEPLDAINVGCGGYDRFWHRHACPPESGVTSAQNEDTP